MKNRFFLAISAMIALSLVAVATAQIDPDKAKKLIGFGKVQGTVTLPSNGQLSCSQVRVGLYRYTSGDPIGAQSAGPVTPTPSGPGKCSYSLSALATGWNVSAGHASSQYSLSFQVSPSAGVMLQKGQTATRDIKITAVNQADIPR